MKLLALDTETNFGGFAPWMPGFYLSVIGVVESEWEPGQDEVVNNVETIWFEHSKELPTVQAIPRLQEKIDSADFVIAHNMKFDMNTLRHYNLNFNIVKVWCTMVGEYLLSGQDPDISIGLNATAERYGMPSKLDAVKQQWDLGVETRDIDSKLLIEYVLDDTRKALDIFKLQYVQASKEKMVPLIKLQSEYIKVLSDIELGGFKFDAEKAQTYHKETIQLINDLEKEFKEICDEPDLNIASPQQLSAVLFGGVLKVKREEWRMIPRKTKPETVYKPFMVEDEYTHPGIGFVPPKGSQKTKDGYYSTNKGMLDQLEIRRDQPATQVAAMRRAKELLFEFSHLNKLANTLLGKEGNGLINKITPDGLIHPTLNNTLTKTGRLSSSNPNSQNLPRGNTSPIKRCIVPQNDGIYQVDLSQIEWRGAAELSGDKVMMTEINSRIDQHARAVTELMELKYIDKSDPESKANRDNAKVFNFRMIYGGSAYGYYLDPKMPAFSKRKWQKIVDNFNTKYEGLYRHNEQNLKHVLSNGVLRIPTGRKFTFKKSIIQDGVPSYNERHVKNYPVQGIAGGDLLPLMAVIIRRGLVKGGFKSKLILTVHDSMVFDYVAEELGRLDKLCLTVAATLPKYIERYFGVPWSTRIDAESEIGPNYGELKGYNETK